MVASPREITVVPKHSLAELLQSDLHLVLYYTWFLYQLGRRGGLVVSLLNFRSNGTGNKIVGLTL